MVPPSRFFKQYTGGRGRRGRYNQGMKQRHMHFQGRYLGLVEEDGWEYATRTNASAVAVIIAVTDQAELVLVEQHRIPVHGPVLELPAGLVGDHDDPHENVSAAAHRELLEETGYAAGRLDRLLECPSSAGMCDELITFFLARRLHRTGPGGGDASENITVHTVPLQGIDRWLADRQASGVQLDPKIYSALYWLGSEKRLLAIAPASQD